MMNTILIIISVILDEKSITENSRTFLKKFKEEKLLQSQKKIEPSLTEDITSNYLIIY